MAKITNHDNAFGSRNSTEPTARTAQRVASKGPLAQLTDGNPLWYNDDTTLLSKTINRLGYPEKRRAGR